MIHSCCLASVSIACVLALSFPPNPTFAQNAAAPAITATYDVAEFLRRSRPDDSPAPKPPTILPDGPIGPNTLLPTHTEAKERLIALVRETIDPKSWTVGHLPPTSIAIEGDKMIVSQTAENQKTIADFLRQMHGDGSAKLQEAYDSHRMPTTKFDKAPLVQAIAEVGKAANIAIEVEWNSFKAIPLAPDAPATIAVKYATPAQAVRALFNSAAGANIGLRLRAFPQKIRITCDDSPAGENVPGVVYDVRYILARASGANLKRPITRDQCLIALSDQIKKEVPGIISLKDVDGVFIIDARPGVHLQIWKFLDEADAQAVAAIDAPLQTVTYDIAPFLQNPRPDDQPNPPLGPVDPDAPIGDYTQRPSRTESRENFVKFIRDEATDARLWQPNHVPRGSLALDGDKLVITAPKEHHRMVANLLKQLNQGSDGSNKLNWNFGLLRVGKLKFEKTTLFEAVATISKETKTPIEVDWKSFENVALLPESPVTLMLNKPTAYAAIRAVFTNAAGYTFPISEGATPKSIKVKFDPKFNNMKPTQELSRLFDIRALPARASGLNVTKPFTRQEAIDALAKRVTKEVPKVLSCHGNQSGVIIVNGTAHVMQQVREYLDDVDARTMAEIEKK
jgi:hypothetical protein